MLLERGSAMNPHQQANLARWNELTAIHARSRFYDVEGFKAGQSSLRPLEVEEVGDVTGKSLLHLQCHFGLDTLSWARRGARVTGIDFSDQAIAQARALSQELGIPAEFVCSTVEDLPRALTGRFDLVFTSYGAICWLADLSAWARTIVHFLEPGGTFYMVEVHPVADVFDDSPGVTELRVAYPYFPQAEPLRLQTQGTYADRSAAVVNTVSYAWIHSVGEVLTALLGAGLRLEFFHEFPYSVFPNYAFVQQDADGWWRPRGQKGSIPLLFSLKATKPR
jgi:SAM-dependent methyltransferase